MTTMPHIKVDVSTLMVVFLLLVQQSHGEERLQTGLGSTAATRTTPSHIHSGLPFPRSSTSRRISPPRLSTGHRMTLITGLTTSSPKPTRLNTDLTSQTTLRAVSPTTSRSRPTTTTTTPGLPSPSSSTMVGLGTGRPPQWVAITCAETYNDTVKGSDTDNGTGSGERYAQSLISDIADVANVSVSRLVEAIALEIPDNGTLVIRFSIVDGRQTNAVEAVDNLKRRLLSDSRRRRRNADAAIPLLRSEVNNGTITPTGIHNWTDDGLCPTARCGHGRYCSWRPAGFYCRCTPRGQRHSFDDDDGCLAVPASTGSCTSRVNCIVPAVVVPIAGLLVIAVLILVIVVLRRREDHDKSFMMVYSRQDSTNPVLDLQNIETQSAMESQVSYVEPPRPPPPSVVDDDARKPRNWTRLRFKRSRRHLDPAATDENGYPSATRSVIHIEDTGSVISDTSGLDIEKPQLIASNEALSY